MKHPYVRFFSFIAMVLILLIARKLLGFEAMVIYGFATTVVSIGMVDFNKTMERGGE